MSNTPQSTLEKPLVKDLIREKVLVLDGAMGTMIQEYKFTEEIIEGAGLPITSIRFKEIMTYSPSPNQRPFKPFMKSIWLRVQIL